MVDEWRISGKRRYDTKKLAQRGREEQRTPASSRERSSSLNRNRAPASSRESITTRQVKNSPSARTRSPTKSSRSPSPRRRSIGDETKQSFGRSLNRGRLDGDEGADESGGQKKSRRQRISAAIGRTVARSKLRSNFPSLKQSKSFGNDQTGFRSPIVRGSGPQPAKIPVSAMRQSSRNSSGGPGPTGGITRFYGPGPVTGSRLSRLSSVRFSKDAETAKTTSLGPRGNSVKSTSRGRFSNSHNKTPVRTSEKRVPEDRRTLDIIVPSS